MRRELLAALTIEANPDARRRLTGAGGHCAGGDVKTMRKRCTAAEGRGRVSSEPSRLEIGELPLPTIAMVDGLGGGPSNLALCCDLIVASDRARFGELFCKDRPRGRRRQHVAPAAPRHGLARAKERSWSSRATSSTPR